MKTFNSFLPQKRIFIIVIISLFFKTSAYAQDRDSVLQVISSRLDDISYQIGWINRYKLYKTENVYTFLKLDTRTGYIDQVQWSLDESKEFTVPINSIILSTSGTCGTFELIPTQNMYQFILLDKEQGRMWHVQWGMETEKRWIRSIE